MFLLGDQGVDAGGLGVQVVGDQPLLDRTYTASGIHGDRPLTVDEELALSAGTHDVAIRAGENGGRTLPHRNIVRELVKLGAWNGKAIGFDLPATKDANYRTVVLVQRGSHGAILGVGRG